MGKIPQAVPCQHLHKYACRHITKRWARMHAHARTT